MAAPILSLICAFTEDWPLGIELMTVFRSALSVLEMIAPMSAASELPTPCSQRGKNIGKVTGGVGKPPSSNP